jgi:hypothetical protein
MTPVAIPFFWVAYFINPVNSLAHSNAQWREIVGSVYVRVPAWVLLEYHVFFDDKLLNTVPIMCVKVN